MNLVMNTLKIMTPWWYYIEMALVSNMFVILFLGLAMIGKLEETYPAWIYGADYTPIFWPCFLIHVSTATLFGLLMIHHDMTSHPECFKKEG